MTHQPALPGLDLPKMWRLSRQSQHTLYYLLLKDGSMPPLPQVDYSELVGLGLVTLTTDTISLTADGRSVLDADFEAQRVCGITFHD